MLLVRWLQLLGLAAVADQAASGDTILIGPGFYYEHIDAAGKTPTFLGLQGRENTVLDGSRPYYDEGGSIIFTYNLPGPIHIAGLTFQNGQGTTTTQADTEALFM